MFQSGISMDEVWRVLAALFGALVPVAIKGAATRREIISNFMVGFGVAFFVTPFAAEHIGLVSENSKTALGFCFGVMGWKFCEWLLVNVPRLADGIVKRWTGVQ